MITIKQWNELSSKLRKRIVKIIFYSFSSEFQDDLSKEYHHNFDWKGDKNSSIDGQWMKILLKHLSKDKYGGIKVTITLI